MFGRSVRTTQPQGPCGIDRANGLAAGLLEVWTPIQLAGVLRGVPVSFGVGASIASRKFTSWRFNGASTAEVNTNLTTGALGIAGNAAKTLFVVYAARVQPIGSVMHIFGSGAGGTSQGDFVLKTLNFDGLNAQLWGSDPAGFTDVLGSDRAMDMAFLSHDGTTTKVTSRTGKRTALTLATATSNNPLRIGRWSFSTANFDGDVYLCGVWNRALSDAEIKSLSDNPWQIFAPDSRALWTPASASVSLPTLVQPTSTTTPGAWTATGAGSLHAAINEAIPSGAEYISVTSASTCEFVLAESAHPGAANQTLAYRASSTAGSTLTVTLMQGVTTIMTRTHSLTSTDTLYTQTLTAPEIATIIAGAISVTLTAT